MPRSDNIDMGIFGVIGLRMNRSADQAGFSLAELVISVGLFSLIVSAASYFSLSSLREISNLNSKSSLDHIRTEILSMLADDTPTADLEIDVANKIVTTTFKHKSWYHTLKHASNVTFSCLLKGTKPCPKGNNTFFNLYDSSDRLLLDSMSSHTGFTKDGQICKSFPKSPCLFKYRLHWEMACEDCEPKQIRIIGELDTAPDAANVIGRTLASKAYELNLIKSAQCLPVRIRRYDHSLVNVQNPTSCDYGDEMRTWVRSQGVQSIDVEVVGGGGSGGTGGDSGSNGGNGAGGGGGGGGYARKNKIDVSGINNIAMQIGVGGKTLHDTFSYAANRCVPGTIGREEAQGGTSFFGNSAASAYALAEGGQGGQGGIAFASRSQSGGGSGGKGVIGDILRDGEYGQPGHNDTFVLGVGGGNGHDKSGGGDANKTTPNIYVNRNGANGGGGSGTSGNTAGSRGGFGYVVVYEYECER